MGKIPQGYQITCTSWEGDFGNFRTLRVSGLTEDEAECRVRLALLMLKSQLDTADGFGNMRNPDDSQIEAFEDAVMAIAACYETIFQDEAYYVDMCEDMIYDMFGGSDYYTRQLDQISVEYLPQSVEYHDVTDQFIRQKTPPV